MYDRYDEEEKDVIMSAIKFEFRVTEHRILNAEGALFAETVSVFPLIEKNISNQHFVNMQGSNDRTLNLEQLAYKSPVPSYLEIEPNYAKCNSFFIILNSSNVFALDPLV